MGIISVEQADRLYWLGRYTERVYTTIRIYSQSFDTMIDEITESYPQFCAQVDIPNIYSDKTDFMNRYPFDPENPDSIISNLTRAYDNAIVLRERIGSETLSYIQLAIYAMNRASKSGAPLIELQKVTDNILAFWGIVDDRIDSEQVRNIIKAGKRIERLDLYARFGADSRELKREVNRLIPRVERSGRAYNIESLSELRSLVAAPSPDYYKIVETVENIY